MSKTALTDEQREHLRELVATLRSGKYKQTGGQLRRVKSTQFFPSDGVGYCCLGVACDISGLGHWVDVAKGDPRYKVTGKNDSSTTALPEAVSEYFGLSDEGTLPKAIRRNGESYASMMCLNDSAKLSFTEIADIIEKQFNL